MEQERQRLKEQAKQDLAMLQERLQRASESLEIEKAQIVKNIEVLVARYERKIATVKQQNQQLIEQLRLANYPIPPKGIRDIDIRCHRIQHIFWRSEIVLDYSKEEQMCDLSKEVFFCTQGILNLSLKLLRNRMSLECSLRRYLMIRVRLRLIRWVQQFASLMTQRKSHWQNIQKSLSSTGSV